MRNGFVQRFDQRRMFADVALVAGVLVVVITLGHEQFLNFSTTMDLQPVASDTLSNSFKVFSLVKYPQLEQNVLLGIRRPFLSPF